MRPVYLIYSLEIGLTHEMETATRRQNIVFELQIVRPWKDKYWRRGTAFTPSLFIIGRKCTDSAEAESENATKIFYYNIRYLNTWKSITNISLCNEYVKCINIKTQKYK